MDERTERLIQATRDLILDEGLHRASMSSISKKANVPVGTIYLRFPSKKALINETYIFCRDKCLSQKHIADSTHNMPFELGFKNMVNNFIKKSMENKKDFLFWNKFHTSSIIEFESYYSPDLKIGNLTFSEASRAGILKNISPEAINWIWLGTTVLLLTAYCNEDPHLNKSELDMLADIAWDAIKA